MNTWKLFPCCYRGGQPRPTAESRQRPVALQQQVKSICTERYSQRPGLLCTGKLGRCENRPITSIVSLYKREIPYEREMNIKQCCETRECQKCSYWALAAQGGLHGGLHKSSCSIPEKTACCVIFQSASSYQHAGGPWNNNNHQRHYLQKLTPVIGTTHLYYAHHCCLHNTWISDLPKVLRPNELNNNTLVLCLTASQSFMSI